MEKTYYSRKNLHFIGWRNITNLTGYRAKSRKEEMQGIQFKDNKFTTDDERMIKILNKYIKSRTDISDTSFTEVEEKRQGEPKVEYKRELFNPKSKDKNEILKSIRALI
jgi:hypothetical protein